MKIAVAYCGYCSIESVDKRTLKIEDDIIECMNCGGKTRLVPIYDGSPYRKLERLDNVQRRG